MHFKSRAQGFSLVELAVVLVIVGLLAGGIITGRALIRASELQSIARDLDRYTTAAFAFQNKYRYLPGDIPEATRYWGAQDANPATCAAFLSGNPATGTETCDGDGNGQISNDDFSGGSTASWYEVWRAWQHLSNAGFIDGKYTGVSDSSSGYTWGTAGVNAPASKFNARMGFAFVWLQYRSTAMLWVFPGEYGNILRVGAGDRMDESYLISANDAWSLDTKMDDGFPGTGTLRTYLSTRRGSCSDSDDPTVSKWRMDRTDERCNLLYITGL